MAPGPPMQPRMLGRYALYEKIASGGMATVHIGRLLGPVGFARTVAIKRMHPQLCEDPDFIAMFLDEARLAARIRHPNVVPTLDVVTTEGELFIVMDYVQGESLARLQRLATARGEQMPPAMAATLMVSVLHGLHAAHEAKNDHGEALGIVHRDVTPQNVLVGTDGVARVLDFGVAKAIGRVHTTREGQLKGKLAYMAPEQLRGVVTRATDVYAASVVLWEALTGKRLFAGENEADLFGRVLAGATVAPSEHVPGLPPALDAVTMRGLRMDPAERFGTAREMARALENAMPLVAASVIGEWVESVAKETLDERSARIAAIETESSLRAGPGAAPPSDRSARPVAGHPTHDISVAVADDAAPTQLSSGSVSAPGRSARAAGIRSGGWRAAALGVLVGLLALGGLAVLWSRHDMPSPSATTPADPSSPSPASAAPATPASAVAPAVASASASAPAVASAAPPPTAVVPAATAAIARPPPRTSPGSASPSPHATATSATSCHPPYYFDGRGVRVFKPECL